MQLIQADGGLTIVGEAADGPAAQEMIWRLAPNIAILDICMPELTGIELTRRIEEQGRETRVVLLTMLDDPTVAVEAQAAGAAGYVLKDNSFEELLVAVRTVAAGGTFVTPSIQSRLRALRRNGRIPMILSPREREVIRLIADGNSSKQIARLLGVSPRTIDTYRIRCMNKLDLHTVADVVRYAVRAGLVE